MFIWAPNKSSFSLDKKIGSCNLKFLHISLTSEEQISKVKFDVFQGQRGDEAENVSLV